LPSDNNIPLEKAIDIITRKVVETKVNEAIQQTLEKRMTNGTNKRSIDVYVDIFLYIFILKKCK
jgi:hypothetical protein